MFNGREDGLCKLPLNSFFCVSPLTQNRGDSTAEKRIPAASQHNIGPILDQYWSNIGPMLAQYWSNIGPILVQNSVIQRAGLFSVSGAEDQGRVVQAPRPSPHAAARFTRPSPSRLRRKEKDSV